MPRVFANNVNLNYVEAGTSDPPLLILHGLGGSHEMWLPILPALAESRRVIAGDQRGHGASDKPGGPYTVRLLAQDWLAAMDALRVQSADLLGLSLGAAVAMRIAADAPTRVRRLILEDTWGVPHPAFTAMLHQRLEILRRGDLRGYADAAIPQVYSEAYVGTHPEAMDAYRERVMKAESASLISAIAACLSHDMRGDLARITAPTLVLVGTPPFQAEYLARAVPGARLHVFKASAHFPNLEEQAEFLRVVEGFCRP